MKVRCINNENRSNNLKLGEIYEAELIDHISGDKRWVVKGIDSMSFYQHRFEVVNEYNIEKAFREVIADIKEGEVWEGSRFTISLGENGSKEKGIKVQLNENVVFDEWFLFMDKDKYTLQRKEYTFEEAFKAYENDIKVESKYSGISYEKNGSVVKVSTINKVSSLDSEFDITFSTGEIRGTWYINN